MEATREYIYIPYDYKIENAPFYGVLRSNMQDNTFESKLTLNISEAAAVLGVSRPTMYELLHQEGFPSFRVGKRVLVPVEALRRWVDQQVGG